MTRKPANTATRRGEPAKPMHRQQGQPQQPKKSRSRHLGRERQLLEMRLLSQSRLGQVVQESPDPRRKPEEWHDLESGSVGAPEVSKVESQVPKSNNFALEVPRTPHNLYMRNTGSVTTKSELNIQIVDFFDYGVLDSAAGGIPQDVTNYFWNINQNLFNDDPTATSDKVATFCRVRKLEVYVLPLKGFNLAEQNAPNDSNADAMYTVNAQVPGVSLTQGSTFSPAVAADTQVTNILPQFDTFWKRVLKCDLDKTFQSGVMRPFYDEGIQRTDQCLFQMSIRDSTNGLPYLPADETGNPLGIRVKVVLHVDQPIATTQAAQLAVFKNEDFSRPSTAQNGTSYPGTSNQYVQMNLTGKLDRFR